jgi:hypothetical protein
VISDVDRYHGIVLRQIVIERGAAKTTLSLADVRGRVDSFEVNGVAFQVKYSTKRLTPWRFGYVSHALRELRELRMVYSRVWVILVCGQDGVVCISPEQLEQIIDCSANTAVWIRVSRSRNAMYRVGGSLGELPRALPRGVGPFVQDVHTYNVRALD